MVNRPDRQTVAACVCRHDPSLRLGNYIGKGKTSDVYELENAYPPYRFAPPRAVKVMFTWCACEDESDSPENIALRQRMYRYFINEDRFMRELCDCEYVMPVLDSFEFLPDTRSVSRECMEKNGYRVLVFLVMPLLPALSDDTHRAELSENDLVRMSLDICTALRECHRRGILHRDVKPWNIFVERFRDGQETKTRFILGDFGLCRRMNLFNGANFSRVGTEWFTSRSIRAGYAPESGCYNSDLYSLGRSVQFLLIGSPDPKDTGELPGISVRFCQIIRKAVRTRASERYPDADAMLTDLQKLSGRTSAEFPDRHGVMSDPDFIGAKQALVQKNDKTALRTAENGAKKGSADCKRLWAYCLYRTYGAEDPESVRTAVRTLEELAYDGDTKARYLCARLYIEQGKSDLGLQILRYTAEVDGVVSALYDYGWRLYNNGPDGNALDGNDPDENGPDGGAGREKGIEMLTKAAKAGYSPALCRLKRMNPPPVPDPEWYAFLETYDDIGNETDIRKLEWEAFVEFL